MEILELFGVDWKLMAAQLVNFAIVVFVLWKFAIKPLMNTMEARNNEIEQGLSDAKAAADKLENTEKDIKGKLQETKAAAADILEAAKKQSDKNQAASVEKTKEEVEALIIKAKEQIDNEKSAMVSEVKGEVADMVVVALQKILSEGLSKEIDQKYIAKVLKDQKNEK